MVHVLYDIIGRKSQINYNISARVCLCVCVVHGDMCGWQLQTYICVQGIASPYVTLSDILPTFWSVSIGDDHKVCDVPLQIKFIARLLFQSCYCLSCFVCLTKAITYHSTSASHFWSKCHHPPSCESGRSHINCMRLVRVCLRMCVPVCVHCAWGHVWVTVHVHWCAPHVAHTHTPHTPHTYLQLVPVIADGRCRLYF